MLCYILPSGWLSSVAYMNALNNARLRAYASQAQSQITTPSTATRASVRASGAASARASGASGASGAASELESGASAPQAEYGIRLVNHPMNRSLAQMSHRSTPSAADMLVATMLIFALSFIPPIFLMFLIEEYTSKSKLLQHLNGLSPFVYWLGMPI